jgi:iron complex transport system substrate-binding protein
MAGSARSLDDVTGNIVDAAYRLHVDLGPGLLESAYALILGRELERRGFLVQRQLPISFDYNGMHFRNCFRIDLLIDARVVVETKSVETLHPVHAKQLLTYLRLTNRPIGLLINFGAATLKEGLRRVVNRLPPSASPRLRVNHPSEPEPPSR